MTWSTDLAVMRCVRCNGFVLAGQCGGVPAAADPGRLDVDGYRLALLAGRKTFRLVRKPSGAPWRLQDDVGAWDSQLDRLGAHGCLNAPLEAIPVAEADGGNPTRAAVGIVDGSTRPLAPASRPTDDEGIADGRRRQGNSDLHDCRVAGDGAVGGGDVGHSHPWLARYCARCRQPIGFECREGISRGEFYDWVIHERCGEVDTEAGCRH